jgi:transposase
MNSENFAAFVGLDWSDRKHDLCLRAAGEKKKEFSILPHKPEAIEEWAQTLRKRFGGQPIAVSLEQSKGAVIAALLKYDFFVLYPVNPSTLAKYREAFTPSRGKDDPKDAEFLMELLETHRDRLRVWKPDDELTRKLQHLVEYRRTLVGERTRISNRMTSYLKQYFPQILDWFPDIRLHMVCDFLLRWPTPESLKGVHCSTLLKFFWSYSSNSKARNEQRIEAIRSIVPLTTDRAIIETTSLMVTALCGQLKVVIDAVNGLEEEIAALCKTHEDFAIFESLPGAGPTLAPRMLAALGTQRDRFTSATAASTYFGIAPVIERSGNSTYIRWRYFCPRFLRQTFHEFAGESIRFSFWAEQFYAGQRAKGKSHHVAIRALAFKWMRIIYRCWQTRMRYDEARYLKALRKSSSPVLTVAAISAA